MSGETRPCVLAGYFGFGNAGDELILQSLLRQVRAAPWVVLSGRPEDTARRTGRPAAGRWDFPALAGLFRRGRALVFGGGELFQTRTSRLSLLYYLALALWARLWGCRLFAYGVALDPDLPRWASAAVRGVLGMAQGLWVRDEAGLEGLQRPALAAGPDAVWSWPVEAAAPSTSLRRVLWILRTDRDPETEAAEWARALNGLSRIAPREHGFLPFHPEADGPLLSRLRLKLEFFHRLELWDRPEEVFDIMKGYDAVVSMRFHGLLCARLLGRPCVAVASHEKVSRLAESLSAPALSRAEAGPEPLARALERAWEDKGRFSGAAALARQARTALAGLEEALLRG